VVHRRQRDAKRHGGQRALAVTVSLSAGSFRMA
jgi:hypothetical protein